MHFVELGPKAKEALPSLWKVMKADDRNLGQTAAYAIWRIGGEVENTNEDAHRRSEG